MTPRRCVAAMASLFGAAWGCGASTEQSAKVIAIAPAAAFNDVAFSVSIKGAWFRPVYHFDTVGASTQSEGGPYAAALAPVGGAAADAVPLEGVAWMSPQSITATAPAGLPAGHYDVVVTDPRGTSARLEDGFTSLGPDTEKPTVSLESPTKGSLIAEGTQLTIGVIADDGGGFVGSLGATVQVPDGIDQELSCTTAPLPHQARCGRPFAIPLLGDQAEAALVITPHATDSADNDADTAPVTFRVVRRPTIASISPTSGPANGGIEIVVTGENFVVPSTEPGAESDGSHLLLDGVALTITSIGPTEIHAELPKHDPGVGQFSVANGDAETPSKLPFDFIGPPIVKLVSPLKGPVTGGTHVFISGNGFRNGDTTVTIGDAPLASLMSHGALMIDGYVPPVDAPGPVPIVVTVGAFATTYYAPFVYEAAIADPPDGGADPVGFTGAK